MYMIGKIIAIFHLIVVCIYSLYGLVTPKNFYADFFYFIFLILVQLSWLLFNHECVFSLIYKKIHYKNYECGDNTDLDDFKELSSSVSSNKSNNKSIDYSDIVANLLNLLYIINLLVVNNRSKITTTFSLVFIFIFLRYFYVYLNNAIGVNTVNTIKKLFGNKCYHVLQRIYDEYQIKCIHDSLNMAIALILILFLLYIIYRNRKRF